MNRRAFLTGLLCAPAIVRASSLMPIKAMPEADLLDIPGAASIELNGLTPIIITPRQLADLRLLYPAGMIDSNLAFAGFKLQVQDAIPIAARSAHGHMFDAVCTRNRAGIFSDASQDV